MFRLDPEAVEMVADALRDDEEKLTGDPRPSVSGT
jgi:hypothetical protein